MKDIDYENLFIYMSLIFAVCIFIIILYGCAFANPAGSNSRENSIIFENFFADDDKRDIKTQVLSELQKLENKSTISAENKKIIKESIENINNNTISITQLTKIIDLLKSHVEKFEEGTKKDDTKKNDAKKNDAKKDDAKKDDTKKDDGDAKKDDDDAKKEEAFKKIQETFKKQKT